LIHPLFSDVKKSIEDHLGDLLREWCIAHFINLILLDAFGWHIDKSKSKNPEARDVIETHRSLIESINKGKSLKKAFEDQQEKVGRKGNQIMKLKNAPHHRWSSIEVVFYRQLQLWNCIAEAYKTENLTNPIATLRRVTVEFLSLLTPVRTIQVIAQKTKEFVVVEVLTMMIALYKNELNPNEPLRLEEPRTINDALTSDPPPVMRNPEALDLRTRKVRKMMREGFNTRFFNRYHPIKAWHNWRIVFGTRIGGDIHAGNVSIRLLRFDYVVDMLMLLWPNMNDGRHLKDCCSEVDISTRDLSGVSMTGRTIKDLRDKMTELLKAALWRKIKEYCLFPAQRLLEKEQNRQDSQVSSPSAPTTPPPRKRQRGDAAAAAGLESPEAEEAAAVAPEEHDNITAEKIVDEEVERFLKIRETWPNDKRKCSYHDFVKWWKNYEDQFYCLSLVARALAGVPPGSGGLECDIGSFKDIISSRRGSLDPGLVDMHMTVKLNPSLHELDTRKVPSLGKKWEDYVPKRPDLPLECFQRLDANEDGQEASTAAAAAAARAPPPASAAEAAAAAEDSEDSMDRMIREIAN